MRVILKCLTMISHGESRDKVCIVCLGRAHLTITDTLIDLVKRHARPNLDTLLKDIRLPKGLCQTCRLTIQDLEKGGQNKRQLRLFDVEKLLPSVRRSEDALVTESSTSCSCLVCRVAKSRGLFSHELSKEIAKFRVGRPRESEEISETESCTKCFGEKRRGVSHVCIKSAVLDNLEKRLSPKTKEQFASRQIKKKAEAEASFSGDSANQIKLSTLGKQLPVTIGSIDKAKKNLQFSADDMSQIQNNLSLSDNQTLKLARGFRSKAGRSIIESNLRESMAESHRSLDTFFDVKNMTFETDFNPETRSYNKEQRPSIVCNDTQGLITHLTEKRGIDPAITLTKITMDGGKGQFKVCLNLIEDHLVTRSPIKKRLRYSDGIQPERAKQGGVLQSIIIGLFPEIPETYHNLQLIYETLELNAVEHIVSADLKVLNLLCGLQPCSSKHPCCFCTWEAGDDSKKTYPLRTMGMIRAQNERWESWSEAERKKGKQPDRSKLKEFDNCEHRPIFEDPDDTLVLDKCPPPQLHIFLGVVNHIIRFLMRVWPQAEEWPKKLCLEREAQFGGTFNGNSCRKLLNNLKVLKELQPPRGVKHYINILDTLNRIVSGCFGSRLSPSFRDDIKQFDVEFKSLVDELGQPVKKTPKVQNLIIHVPQFCQKTGVGLGVFSEQVVEAQHSEFHKTWKNFMVPLGHAKYGQRLFRAVMKVNTSHQ